MTDYETRIEIKIPKRIDKEALDRVYDELLDDGYLVDPIMSCDLEEENTLALSYEFEAANPYEAVKAGMDKLWDHLGYTNPNRSQVVSIDAHPYIDPELAELVSQAEMARRLGLSRERVRQLAAHPDFPVPVQPSVRTGLYRWGDIMRWNERRLERVRPAA